MVRLFVRASTFIVCVFVAIPAQAQEAVVLSSAPIYLYPDTNRVPLRTAAVDTRVRVLEEAPTGWLKVEFRDPQFGIRVGFMEAKHARVERPELTPMDLSVPKAPAATADARDARQVPSRAPVPTSPSSFRRSAYAMGVAGVTFQSEASSLFGGEFGGFVTRDLQVYGQVGQMINALPSDIQDDLDDLGETLTLLTGTRWEFDGKLPATYFGGGVKYLIPTGVAVRPYVIGGISGARFDLSVREIDLGEITDELVDEGYLDPSDVKATKAGFEAGGGIHVPIGALLLDGGYRYMKFFDSEIQVSRFVFGIGARF
jgi:opacity protein-like surface antigen